MGIIQDELPDYPLFSPNLMNAESITDTCVPPDECNSIFTANKTNDRKVCQRIPSNIIPSLSRGGAEVMAYQYWSYLKRGIL